eukprot:740359-Amphidinium_carterae.2
MTPLGRTYTTVMLQNLPRLFSQKALLAELEATGYGGTFDFCYAPIVFSTGPHVLAVGAYRPNSYPPLGKHSTDSRKEPFSRADVPTMD